MSSLYLHKHIDASFNTRNDIYNIDDYKSGSLHTYRPSMTTLAPCFSDSDLTKIVFVW